MTPTQYNPYSVNFFPNDRFEISFKDQSIVAEGRQRESELIKATVDLLNRAYSEGVHEVKVERDQTISILEAELAERDERIANQVATYTDIVNRYYALRQQSVEQPIVADTAVRTPEDMLETYFTNKTKMQQAEQFNSDSPEYEYTQPDDGPGETCDEALPEEVVDWTEATAEAIDTAPKFVAKAQTRAQTKAKPVKRKGK